MSRFYVNPRNFYPRNIQFSAVFHALPFVPVDFFDDFYDVLYKKMWNFLAHPMIYLGM